ncbi:hypothetical protein ACN1C3_23860 [Pseudomonas sp. H11T01]|uniref:hypothetical protein n=1 Tax=Pseudomonas sp. H11T01 TaxID=3402749 RepID=UPI003ACC9406
MLQNLKRNWLAYSVLVGAALGLGFVYFGVLRTDDLPAWVQAYGSIGAILVAISISLSQQKHEAESSLISNQQAIEQKHHLALNYARSVFQIAYELQFLMIRISGQVKELKKPDFAQLEFGLNDLLSRLAKLDVGPVTNKLTLVFEMRQQLLRLHDFLARSIQINDDFYRIDQECSDVKESIEHLATMAKIELTAVEARILSPT